MDRVICPLGLMTLVFIVHTAFVKLIVREWFQPGAEISNYCFRQIYWSRHIRPPPLNAAKS